MGCTLSKQPQSISIFVVNGDGSSNGSTAASAAAETNKVQYRTEIRSYQHSCERDPDIRSFDTGLQERMTRIVSTIAHDVDLQIHAISFDSLKEVTGCFLDMNKEVVNVILKSKEDAWKNPELFSLVQEYFDSSLQTLDFCAVLEKCLKRAQNSVVVAQLALHCFQEEEEEEAGAEVPENKYKSTLEGLRRFSEAGDPFTDEFFKAFDAVRNQQVLMLSKLRRQREKLDKKIKKVKSWRKVSSVIFVSAVAAILICSVVAAAMAAPPVAAALAAAVSVPLGSMGKWIDSLWKGYENAIKGQKDLVNTMRFQTILVQTDLDVIKVLVDKMRSDIEGLMFSANFASMGDEAVKIAMDEIKKKLELFMTSVDVLGRQADRCIRDTQMARTVVLREIMQPRNENGNGNGNGNGRNS